MATNENVSGNEAYSKNEIAEEQNDLPQSEPYQDPNYQFKCFILSGILLFNVTLHLVRLSEVEAPRRNKYRNYAQRH